MAGGDDGDENHGPRKEETKRAAPPVVPPPLATTETTAINNSSSRSAGSTSPLPPSAAASSGSRTPPPRPEATYNSQCVVTPQTLDNNMILSMAMNKNKGSVSPKNQHNRFPSSLGNSASYSPHNNNRPRMTSLDLYDVLSSGPHELEAETQILRAVEKMTGQAHQRSRTETSRLYNTIAGDELQATNSISSGSYHGGGGAGAGAGGGGPPPMGSITTTATPTAPTTTDPLLASSPNPNDTTTTTTTNTNNANQPPVAPPAAGAGRARFRGLIQKTINANHVDDSSHNNVEQTLFGLTSALTEMNELSGGSRRTSVMGNFATTLTSADKLAATVQQVFQEKRDKNDNDDGGGGGGGGDVEEGLMTRNRQPSMKQILEGDDDDDEDDDQDDAPSVTDRSTGTSVDDSVNPNNSKNSNKKKTRKKHRNKGAQIVSAASDGLKADLELFNEFLGGNKKSMKTYARTVVLFIIIPSILLSGLLFYFVETEINIYGVPEKYSKSRIIEPEQDASVSWWILFICVRQVVTLTMALITQALVIDYLALGSRFSLRWFGPIITLLVVQSKGWPFIAIFWGLYDLALLSGNKRYARHWLYWQEYIDLFNEQNPGGNVINSDFNYKLLTTVIIIGVAVSIKRLVVGLFLGRQTFAQYGQELASVMKNMVLVGEVATLAKEIEKDRKYYEPSTAANPSIRASGEDWAPNTISDFVKKEADEAALEAEEDIARNSEAASAADAAAAFMESRAKMKEAHNTTNSNNGIVNDKPDADFTESEHVAISELLDAWEEPTRPEETEERKITIGAVMQFRQALTFMKRKYPFLPSFGPADSRERCIESSQAVYDRLMMRTPTLDSLPFATLALLAKDDKGGINQNKAKQLIKVFRPERDGSLGKLEFVKSIDVIYKQLRLLSANISNSSQIDKAIESLLNVAFYVLLGVCVLAAMGQSPKAIFLSFSSVILGFAFMFGASSSKFFEGLLFILVQRPYGVGDRIHLSNPQNETSPEGSSGWIVEKVTLTTTTVYWGATNERATLSNGAISNLRVINAARSPNATVFVELKFGIDTPYEKIAIFRTAVEQFLKDRPREWLNFVGFRPTEVAVDRGFIGYKIIAQHRNHWQGIGGIVESKANLTTYCMEVARQLDMRFHAPPLPVSLKLTGTAASALQGLQGNRGVELDQRKITEALRANSSRSMKHQAFAEGDE